MAKPITVLLLYGGKSGEHEISLRSAASVLQHLNAEKYQIKPIAIDKEGQLHVHNYQDLLAYKEALPVTTEHSKPLLSLLSNGKLAIEADIVFPVLHGPLYEDGCIQGLLRLAGIAFVGSDILSSALGMDKDMARRIACSDKILSAKYKVLSALSSADQRLQFCKEAALELGWPLFVKPCSMGSSVGIHKVFNLQELQAALDDAFRYDETILVESFVEGREIELAVLESACGSQEPKVSVVGEIKTHHPDGFYSYRAKYLDSNQTELILPAPMSENLTLALQQAAKEIFTRLKCKGLARVDFFVDDKNNKIYFNEINTMPGFTSISMYPRLWQASGISYQALLDSLIALGLAQQKRLQNLVTNYQ
jgi:D-alanine-D-alanine ligase